MLEAATVILGYWSSLWSAVWMVVVKGRRVAVPEPEEDVENDGRRAVAAERTRQVDGEERRPAQHETADDESSLTRSEKIKN